MMLELQIIPFGSFFARPETVGTDDAELEAIAPQESDDQKERMRHIRSNMAEACGMLSGAVTVGRH